MNQANDNRIDVLIVGAGPTGLMMACQLANHQVSFRIIDKKEFSSTNSGALIVQARTLEIFEQMGIANEALSAGLVANKVNILYNGKIAASTAINDIGKNLSKFPFLLMLEQSKTEKLLLKFINERGHSVERGITFKSFIKENDGVSSIIISPDGTEQVIRSNYIIAADGAKSTIRTLLNIPFIGKTYPKPIFILDCKAKTELIAGEINFAFSKSTVAGFFPLQGSRWRIDSSLPKELQKTETITFNQIEKSFHLWSKMDITFEGNEWFSVSHSHQKYAKSVQFGNCFLMGDAAHVNTPVGAQGMNTGLQDAFNLAWKLAFVVKHKAKADILNTYSSERLAISKGFARYADTAFRIVTSNRITVKFFRRYLLRIFFMFLFPLVEKRIAFRQKFFKSISQIGINYRNSILSYKGIERDFLPNAPKAGDRLPYIEFIHNGKSTNSYEVLNPTSFNLFVFANVITDEINEISEKYNLPITLISSEKQTKKSYESFGIKSTGYYLIRPDMHIALRSDTLDTKHLNIYLQEYLMVLKSMVR